jgi:hypothetical protein
MPPVINNIDQSVDDSDSDYNSDNETITINPVRIPDEDTVRLMNYIATLEQLVLDLNAEVNFHRHNQNLVPKITPIVPAFIIDTLPEASFIIEGDRVLQQVRWIDND